MAAELCREWLKMNQRTDFHGNEGTCRPVWLTDVLLRLLDKNGPLRQRGKHYIRLWLHKQCLLLFNLIRLLVVLRNKIKVD